MPSQSQAVAVINGVRGGLEKRIDNIAAMLPPGYDAARFTTQAIQAIGTNDKLLECSVDSLVLSVMQAAEIGLDLSPALGQCCLVPRSKVAKFQIMKQGFITLIVGGGGARAITGHVVYEGDDFEYDEANQKIVRHVRCGESSPKKLTHAYARAVLPSGEVIFDVLTKEKVFRARDSSSAYQYAKKNGKSSIWTSNNEDEMWMKTAVRHISKSLPLKDASFGSRLSRAFEIDNSEFETEPSTAQTIKKPRRKSDPAPAVVDAESEDLEENEEPGDARETEEAGEFPLMVVSGSKEEGAKNGKKWTKYSLTFNDGKTIGTFSSTLFALGKKSKSEGKAVKITTETKGEFINLKTLEIVE